MRWVAALQGLPDITYEIIDEEEQPETMDDTARRERALEVGPEMHGTPHNRSRTQSLGMLLEAGDLRVNVFPLLHHKLDPVDAVLQPNFEATYSTIPY